MDPLTTVQKAEPLRGVEWKFPLGCATARLEIVADPDREIFPEDMDALIEIAELFRASLRRRRAPVENATLSGGTDPKVGQGVKPEIAEPIIGQVEALKKENDVLLAKYRAAFEGLEIIITTHCDAQKVAAAALQRCAYFDKG